jgi:DNA-binding CsgD family transcriptional regulator
MKTIAATIDVAQPAFARIIDGVLPELDPSSSYIANILIDTPTGYAIQRLSGYAIAIRSRTVVLTHNASPIYNDALAAFHIAAIITTFETPDILSGVYAAATQKRTTEWQTGFSYMELRVLQVLLTGATTAQVAKKLGISHKTVNAHVSNMLGKTRFENRARLITAALGAPHAAQEVE